MSKVPAAPFRASGGSAARGPPAGQEQEGNGQPGYAVQISASHG